MNNIRMIWIVAFAVGMAPAVGQADIPTSVQKKLRGNVLVTTDELPVELGAGALAKYKGLNQKTLTHEVIDGVPAWSFHYTAFLKRAPRAAALSIDFHTASGKKKFVANKRLVGVDPKLKVLSGHLIMSEDDNLNKGRTYHVEVTVQKGRRHIVLAKTKVSLK